MIPSSARTRFRAAVVGGVLAVLIGGVWWARAAPPEPESPPVPDMMVRIGKIAAVADTKLTITDEDRRPHTFVVPSNAVITLDELKARMDDLKVGFKAQVTANRAGDEEIARVIEARSL